ncbi:MAG: 50S ribosomal protein L25/general stress protein Ctc [Proteobacteria bacterium]|nr:50S ribosomal protein L25/general stress protein Ctc [Pseudomonadota bacterium]
MVEVMHLTARTREPGPRSSSRALRRDGRVPAIVYGGGKDPEQVSVDAVALVKEIDRGGFANRLIDLDAGGGTQRVLPREVQLHPVTDRPMHVDFLRLSADSQIRLAVAVEFIDEEASPGIKRGGLVNVVRHEIELICRADSIPEKLTASLAGLDIGDSLHISSITLPDNVQLTITDRDFTVATIAAPTLMEEAEPTEEVEGVEGEAAEVEKGEKKDSGE